MFSFLADHLRMSGSKVCEHLSRIVEVKIDLTAVVVFLRTVRHGVLSRLKPDDMTRVCGEDSVPIRVSHGMVRKWFDMDIFRVLRRAHCNPILALLEIVWLVKVDWNKTGVKWFSFD